MSNVARDIIQTTPAPAPAVSESAALISMIERAARDPNVDVDKMERLFVMQERAMERRAKVAYVEALAKMQPELPTIERNGRIVIHNKEDRQAKVLNPRVEQSTPYALWEDINEAIKPVLAQHGFSLSFRSGVAGDGKLTVTGILSHSEGHSEETTMTLMHDSSGSKNPVQAVGSSMSYGKRYTAMMLLNITSRAKPDADDDGKAAGQEAGPELISQEQAERITALLTETKADVVAFRNTFGIPTILDLPAKDLQRAMTMLETKRRRQQQEGANGR